MMTGDRVRHTRTGECGVVTDLLESYPDTMRKTHYLATVRLDDGRIVSANGSDLEVVNR